MTKVLTKLRIDEVSVCDRGAGEGVDVVLRKRDENVPPTPFETHEAALQKIADIETQQALEGAARWPRTDGTRAIFAAPVRARHQARRASTRIPPGNSAYAALMKRATELAQSDPSRTPCAAFLCVRRRSSKS